MDYACKSRELRFDMEPSRSAAPPRRARYTNTQLEEEEEWREKGENVKKEGRHWHILYNCVFSYLCK
jgi:hypothetical protein